MAFVKPDKEEMRARFWLLKRAVDAGKDKILPLQAKLDDHVNKAREKELELHAPIAAIREDVVDGISMFDAEQEVAMLARYLGNVGEPV